jgi:hypothetical protein
VVHRAVLRIEHTKLVNIVEDTLCSSLRGELTGNISFFVEYLNDRSVGQIER